MKSIAEYLRNLIKGVFSARRFIRLTPNQKGKIFFFDKHRMRVFDVHSRGFTDSGTSNQIYSNEDYSLRSLVRGGEMYGVYNQIVDSGGTPLIIECGGNIGLASRYFAEEFPKALVICVEPNKGNILAAKKNCEELNNVVVKEAAIGASCGFVDITNAEADPNFYRVAVTESPSLTPMVNVQELLRENDKCSLFMIKIDIEGFEENLFSENVEWIDEAPLLIIELHDWMLPKEANSSNFLNAISKRNRDFVYVGENVFSIRN